MDLRSWNGNEENRKRETGQIITGWRRSWWKEYEKRIMMIRKRWWKIWLNGWWWLWLGKDEGDADICSFLPLPPPPLFPENFSRIEAEHLGYLSQSHLIWNLTFFIFWFLIFQFLRIGNRYILDGNLCQNSMHNKLEWPRVSTDFEFDFLTYLDKVVVRVVSIYFFVEKKTLCLTKMQWPGSILWVRGTFHYKNIFRGERREECENCEKSEKI